MKKTIDKALAINLDDSRYGSFAEIGAGQEVVRWFFQAGGAAGTIAKSMSAYDMDVSDAIYGNTGRYVSRDRLQDMLDHEYDLNLKRLSKSRGHKSAFFSFANTVAARNYKGTNRCHGWIGVKFQSHIQDESSQIVLHVRMRDSTNALQQQSVGIVGVNLLYGAFFHFHEPERLIKSLLDNVSLSRIEIDMIEFSGIEFRNIDNRIMSLKLVQLGLSKAALFSADCKVLHPMEAFYKKAVIVERGRFKPVTKLHVDLMNSATEQFIIDNNLTKKDVVPVMEMTMNTLVEKGELDLQAFLVKADMLCSLGITVLISDYFEYYKLGQYLSRNTTYPIAIAMGILSLNNIFEDKYYSNLEGGLLEALGRLLKNNVNLYIYPYKDDKKKEIISLDNFKLDEKTKYIFNHLKSQGYLKGLTNYNTDLLDIYTDVVLDKIEKGDNSWQDMVPSSVIEIIKNNYSFNQS